LRNAQDEDKMEFGICLPTKANSWEVVKRAEELGFTYAWFYDTHLLSADVLVDGITFGAATYGLTRTDICTPLPAGTPGCPNIGFIFSLNPKSTTLPIAAGNHTLAVRVRDELGNFTGIPSTPLTITVR